jgi:DNA sulfur modification protein DndD
MFLTQLQLRNWRSYRNATFTFPVPDRAGKRNIILVGAQNGVGKTSFLVALYLGLFGREAMSMVEGFRASLVGDDRLLSYQKLIEGILHRPAKTDDDPHCSVGLTFLVDGEKIVIQRRWTFRHGGRVRDLDTADGEEVLIEANHRKKSYGTWQEANNRIEELIFPCNVMPCLFFDGEQAQARVEAASGRALFDAVKTLYGTGLLEQLSESLKTYIVNERHALARDVGSVKLDELDRKRQDLDQRRDQLRELQTQLQAKRKERADAESRRRKIEDDLYQLVGDKVSDIEEYSAAVLALQQEEQTLRQTLIDHIGTVALPLAVGKNIRRLLENLKAEGVRERWIMLKDEASGKAGMILEDVLPQHSPPDVEPPLLDAQIIQLRSILEKSLERLWSPPPDGCASDFLFPFLQSTDRQSAISKLGRLSTDVTAKLSKAALDLQSVTTRLSDTRLRYERTREIQPQLARLKADLQTALELHRSLSSEVAGLENRERSDLQTINDLRGAIGQMESKKEALNPVQAKLEVAQRIRSLVDDAKDQLVPLCKHELEERCTVHFRAMISDEYGRFRARFETESEPWLEGPKGQQVLVSTMSGAQKRAFGLAFTLAVADVASREAPIVIDTPVGNMDSAYRSRVLKYVAEAAAGQVIFLSHDEEIYGRYVDDLRPRIIQQNLVEFSSVDDGSGVSKVVEGQYF